MAEWFKAAHLSFSQTKLCYRKMRAFEPHWWQFLLAPGGGGTCLIRDRGVVSAEAARYVFCGISCRCAKGYKTKLSKHVRMAGI